MQNRLYFESWCMSLWHLYLESIINDSVVACDEVIEPTKITAICFGDKNTTCKIDNVYILLAFVLFTILLLIIISICITITA